MADILDRLGDLLEARYNERHDMIGRRDYVSDWDDYNFRAGYLKAIRDVGGFIKKIRNPVAVEETGEIPDVIATEPTTNE